MPRDRAYLVIAQTRGESRDFLAESEEEMKELTESAGGVVVGISYAPLPHPSPSHFIREGKLSEVRTQANQLGGNLLIFNADLSPGQARNIEAFTGLRVVDRTGLILDIFSRRAQSKEGRMQVELAQLNYLLPRLVGQGVIMSRLGGGIGARGPGEQKLEVDRRKIRARIQHIKQDMKKLEKHRELLRQARRDRRFVQIALVGYTNAGKSTLLNALTGAGTYVENKLFATLDPKTRVLNVHGHERILFTDTVGFLKNLPHSLVEAFHATLEEVVMADFLIHVFDISHPRVEDQKAAVERVLQDIGAHEKPVILALNKADRLNEHDRARFQNRFPEGILISALKKEGLQGLLLKVDVFIPRSVPPQAPGSPAVA